MTFASLPVKNRGRQSGVVLVVGLIFLILLTLIGVTAFSVATQEERMSGNARDRALAFEAAEQALRNCEEYLGSPLPPKGSTDGSLDPGMYKVPPSPTPGPDKWETLDWKTATNVVGNTNTARFVTISGTAGPGKCIVEEVTPVVRQRASIRAELPIQQDTAYMITARGVGINPNTQVFLQSYYIRN